jgi:predicted nuclease of restriction endonuclease-like RecB superfamily
MDPRVLREAVFGEAGRAGPGTDRDALLERVAEGLGISAGTVEAGLYADLPERHVLATAPALDPHQVISLYNRALLQGLLRCAEEVAITAAAQVRAVVRFAKLQRLLCWVERPDRAPASIRVSGPLSVLRETRKYGLAMARFVPALCSAPDWRLRAPCVLRGQRCVLEAAAGPLLAAHRAPRQFDSRVEERLYKDLMARVPEWSIEREPEPLTVGATLVFPDFGVRLPDGRRVLVEIIGFWTPEYLTRKLQGLNDPAMRNVILCVDERLPIEGRVALSSRVLQFRNRVDAAALCTLIERAAGERVAGRLSCRTGGATR